MRQRAGKRRTRPLTSLVSDCSSRPCWPTMTGTLLGTLSFLSSLRVTPRDRMIRRSWMRRDRPPASSGPSSSVSVTRTHSPSSSSPPELPGRTNSDVNKATNPNPRPRPPSRLRPRPQPPKPRPKPRNVRKCHSSHPINAWRCLSC